MTPRRFDVIVIGVGGMGSAALHHLARRGKRVVGLERFRIPHDRGSSHGHSRIFRMAYFEHPDYVPLLRRARALWESLEGEAGEKLLFRTGSISAGPPNAPVYAASLESCVIHGLAHETLSPAEVARRFPGYSLPAGTAALYQPDGGFLAPERCILAHVKAAERRGAEVRAEDAALEWGRADGGVFVRTECAVYAAERLVVCAGAWTGALLPRLAPVAAPERQVLMWMRPAAPPELFRPDRFPVFNIDAGSAGTFYGCPEFGTPGVKLGRYQRGGGRADPDAMDRETRRADELPLRRFAELHLAGGAGDALAMNTCIFTNTPDEHFIVDRLPDAPEVVVGAGFSGHGFKFASAIGEILADLAMDRTPAADCGLLGLGRLL